MISPSRPTGFSKILILVGLVAVLGVLGLQRWRGTALDRPFEEDEWLTIATYTWAETQPSGERRELDRIADYRAIPRPTARQLAMGVYCAAGRWPEPNNHIVHSLLVNGSESVHRSERWARLPALMGGLAFSGGMFWLCGPVIRWWSVAPLVLAGSWFWPYTVHFSQTARGYSWSLALPVLWLIAAHALARRPGSLGLGALCSALAVLTFLNLVSLALDWLLPAYFALLVARPKEESGPLNGIEDPSPQLGGVHRVVATRWRTVVMAQALAVGAVGLTFLVAHLPAVFSSARQYGESFASLGDFSRLLGSTFDYLFPGAAGKAIMAGGLAGIALMGILRRHPFLAWLGIGVVGVSLAHFLLTRRLPYPRAAGYLLLPAFLGAAFLAEIGLSRLPAGRARVVGWLVLASALAWGLRSIQPTVGDADYERFVVRLGESPTPPTRWTVRIRDTKVDAAVDAYRPGDWDAPEVLTPGHAVRLCFLFRGEPGENHTLNVVRRGEVEAWSPSSEVAGVAEGQYRLVRLNGATQALRDTPKDRALIFWYPDPEKLGLDSRQQLDLARDSGLRYLTKTDRHRVKMDVFGRLHAIIFVADSAREYEECALVVESGLRRFGGSSVALTIE